MSKIPIVIPTYNRVQYLTELINGLRLCDNINLFKIYTSEEPGFPDVQQLINSIDFIEVQRYTNPYQYRLEKNVIQAINIGFRHHDFIVVLEDDIVPGKDFLNLMLWADDNFRNDQSIFSISGQNVSHNKIPIEQAKDVVKVPKYFHGLGWASWKDRWEYPGLQQGLQEVIKSNEKNIDCPGWDWQCTFRVRDAVPDMYSLRSVLPRSKHIGIIGQHIPSPQWHRDNVETNCFVNDDSRYFTNREEFRLV